MPHLKIRGIEKNLIVENSKEIMEVKSSQVCIYKRN